MNLGIPEGGMSTVTSFSKWLRILQDLIYQQQRILLCDVMDGPSPETSLFDFAKELAGDSPCCPLFPFRKSS